MDDQPGEKSEKRPSSNNQPRKSAEKTTGAGQKDGQNVAARTEQKGAMAGALAQALASARKDGR